MRKVLIYIFLLVTADFAIAQEKPAVNLVDVGPGWARNSINAVVFRKNSLVTYKDTQFIAYYDGDGYMVLGKRRSGDRQWQLKKTPYRGNTSDAHNSISIMTDGEGYLHIAWDHHNNPLRYCKSITPGSLELTDKMSMTGELEQKLSYPEFFRMADGGLLFLYRDGGSGQGNLVINKYDINTRKWSRLHSNLVDGEGKRNAYWQVFVDSRGVIHLSWVWRESPDVASNHDLCYARSDDGGISWSNSKGEQYKLPITAATAEYAWRIPQSSELINQASMFADAAGNPYIATYWRDAGDSVPQYRIVYKLNNEWQEQDLAFRKTPFSLSGGGTKKIPISRPQVIAWKKGRKTGAVLFFRDAERGSKVSVAVCKDIKKGKWKVKDLFDESVGSWEPSYDTELWKDKKIINLFVQHVEQADAEGTTGIAPQMVKVLEWKPG